MMFCCNNTCQKIIKQKNLFPFYYSLIYDNICPVPFNLIMLRPMTFMVLLTFINVITIHYHIIIIITPRQHKQHQEHLYLAMHQYQLKIFRCERAMATISFCHPCISCLQSWFLLLIFHSIISLIYFSSPRGGLFSFSRFVASI